MAMQLDQTLAICLGALVIAYAFFYFGHTRGKDDGYSEADYHRWKSNEQRGMTHLNRPQQNNQNNRRNRRR